MTSWTIPEEEVPSAVLPDPHVVQPPLSQPAAPARGTTSSPPQLAVSHLQAFFEAPARTASSVSPPVVRAASPDVVPRISRSQSWGGESSSSSQIIKGKRTSVRETKDELHKLRNAKGVTAFDAAKLEAVISSVHCLVPSKQKQKSQFARSAGGWELQTHKAVSGKSTQFRDSLGGMLLRRHSSVGAVEVGMVHNWEGRSEEEEQEEEQEEVGRSMRATI